MCTSLADHKGNRCKGLSKHSIPTNKVTSHMQQNHKMLKQISDNISVTRPDSQLLYTHSMVHSLLQYINAYYVHIEEARSSKPDQL